MSSNREPGVVQGLFNPVTLLLAALLILVGCLPFAAAVMLYTLHSRAELSEAEVNAAKTATLLLRSFEQTIEPIDSLLQNFASTFDPSWTPQQTYDVLRAYSLPASIVQVAVIDREGIMVASNLAMPDGKRLDLSDREHFRVHRDRNVAHGELFISKPVLGRVSNTWTVQLTRALDDGHGHFGGVIVASYAISDFIDFYKKLRVEDDMLIALVGFDGIVRARAAGRTSFGDDISNSPVFKRIKGVREAVYEFTSSLDGIERVGYMIKSERYPIFVVVAYSLEYVREQTRDFRAAIWGTALGLAVALLILVLLARRYLNMQNRLYTRELEGLARQREADVLGAISRVPGICVMQVNEDGPTLIGGAGSGPLSAALGRYLKGGRFQALSAGLKAPLVCSEHLAGAGQQDLEVEMAVAPLRTIEAGERAEGARKEVVVFALDQTPRRMEENQLYQMSKLASLGEVATGLAHEINQPLGVIRLAATNALTGMKKGLPPEHLSGKLQRIIQQTERMSRIIDHMRIFGRKSDERLQPSEATAAVEGALQVVGAHFRLDNIDLSTRFEPALPEVLCRQDQLEQVIINLLQNARDALVEHRPDVSGAARRRIRIDVARESAATSPAMVRIEVADNAGGIPEGIIERVFQPFFTTKPPGKGTGLGLSVSFGIIRDHGGSLSVRNGPDGAVFTIRLPVRGADTPPPSPPDAPPAIPAASDTPS